MAGENLLPSAIEVESDRMDDTTLQLAGDLFATLKDLIEGSTRQATYGTFGVEFTVHDGQIIGFDRIDRIKRRVKR